MVVITGSESTIHDPAAEEELSRGVSPERFLVLIEEGRLEGWFVELVNSGEAARRMGVTKQRMGILLKQGRIVGAEQVNGAWVIPVKAVSMNSGPADALGLEGQRC